MQIATLATDLRSCIIFLKRSLVGIQNDISNVWGVISPRFCRLISGFSSAFFKTMINILSTDHSIKEKTNSKKWYYFKILIRIRQFKSTYSKCITYLRVKTRCFVKIFIVLNDLKTIWFVVIIIFKDHIRPYIGIYTPYPPILLNENTGIC